jgi:oligopeptide/dipeptide ABC transporter ATP-binding protein
MQDILKYNKDEVKQLRKKIQMIFQDPYSALNPIKTVFAAFDEPLKVNGVKNPKKRKEIIEKTLSMVNILPEYMYRYPHEFSGGQKQRICIARALCVSPEILICDEPVSSLDVSIQAQVLNIMKDIQEELGLTYIFIAHDLSVVQYMSDRIAVMYLGKIVEFADSEILYNKTLHPYTKALLSAIPIPSLDKKKERIMLKGDVPSPINKPSGCSFHTRCDYCMDICKIEDPILKEENKEVNHLVACHLYK